MSSKMKRTGSLSIAISLLSLVHKALKTYSTPTMSRAHRKTRTSSASTISTCSVYLRVYCKPTTRRPSRSDTKHPETRKQSTPKCAKCTTCQFAAKQRPWRSCHTSPQRSSVPTVCGKAKLKTLCSIGSNKSVCTTSIVTMTRKICRSHCCSFCSNKPSHSTPNFVKSRIRRNNWLLSRARH